MGTLNEPTRAFDTMLSTHMTAQTHSPLFNKDVKTTSSYFGIDISVIFWQCLYCCNIDCFVNSK